MEHTGGFACLGLFITYQLYGALLLLTIFQSARFFCIFLNWLEYSRESESGHKEGDEMQPMTRSSVVTS